MWSGLEALYDSVKCGFHWSIVIHAGYLVVSGYWNDCLNQGRTVVCTKDKFSSLAEVDTQQKRKRQIE